MTVEDVDADVDMSFDKPSPGNKKINDTEQNLNNSKMKHYFRNNKDYNLLGSKLPKFTAAQPKTSRQPITANQSARKKTLSSLAIYQKNTQNSPKKPNFSQQAKMLRLVK